LFIFSASPLPAAKSLQAAIRSMVD